MKKLLKSLSDCREYRKMYKIAPSACFEFDDRDYMFAIFPTVYIQPQTFRPVNTYVVEIHWLNIHIGLGLWTMGSKEEDE